MNLEINEHKPHLKFSQKNKIFMKKKFMKKITVIKNNKKY